MRRKLTGNFTLVPNTVITLLPSLGEKAFTLYVYLRMRANERGECWPAILTIEKDTGISRNRLLREARNLEEHGLLERKKGWSRSTIYRVLEPIKNLQDSRKQESSIPENGNPSIPENGNLTITKEQEPKNKNHISHEGKQMTTAEEYKARTLRAMTRGQEEQITLEARVKRSLHIEPNWSYKSNAEFMHWLKERPERETIEKFAEWWYKNDWRGKKFQPPTLALVRELWPTAMLSAKTSSSADRYEWK